MRRNDGAAEFIGKLFEVVKVELIVLFRVEAGRAIVTALDDVPRDAGERKSGCLSLAPLIYCSRSKAGATDQSPPSIASTDITVIRSDFETILGSSSIFQPLTVPLSSITM